MSISAVAWRLIGDPIVRRIERRLAHYKSLERVTHDGRSWNDIATIAKECVFYPEALLANQAGPDRLTIGPYCHVRGEVQVLRDGMFSLGHHSFIGPGSRIWCRSGIVIGAHVLISHLVDIHDSDSHSTDFLMRRNEATALFEHRMESSSTEVLSARVTIEDDVWIGFKSSILKGVHIGQGAIVAAGSVVTKDVPALCLVAGNPARIVRQLHVSPSHYNENPTELRLP